MNRGDVFDSRDSAIKLFGKTISAPESRAPLTAAPKPDVGFQILGKSQALDLYSDIAKAEPKDARLEDHGNQANSSVAVEGEEDKVLRKPDKIIPCPRCNSMDTKFCYFNNYNVNQPRHYCKNCQRYWTAGGTMRNVPVGAGRRKNKQFPSQYGHISASAPSEPQEVPDPTNLRSPSVESHSALDGKMQELGREKREDTSSCVSSVTSGTQWYRVPISVAPSVQVWNGNVSANPVQWCTPQLLSVHGFSPNIPSQFVPVSYFGSLPYWPNGAAQKPMAVSDDHRSPTSSTSNGCSGSKSPTLGKRSMGGEDASEKCVSVSKIPRVDDSDKDLKNSFLGTLGFKHNQNERNFQGSMFIPFKSTADCKELASDKSEVLEANPAALSRSHTFQEST